MVNTSETAELSFKERQRRLREEEILNAAEDLLARGSVHALSLDEVAARVGIAKGTIYLHFAAKDALLAVLVTRNMDKIIALIDALDPARPVLERLRVVMRYLLQRHAHGIQSMHEDLQEFRRILETDARCKEMVGVLRARLGALVDEGKRNAEIDPLLPTPIVVGALFSILSPRNYAHMLADGSTTNEELADALIRLLLRGIARDPSTVSLSGGDTA